jgi:choline dehydrogenase-like flavoprotein
MRRYGSSEQVDYCIVGVGSAGGVLLQRLARAGFSVVGLEAGPFWDTERDWVSDEAGSYNLYWNELRITGGKDPLALGRKQQRDEGLVAARCIGPDSLRGSTLPISAFTLKMASGLTGQSHMKK